MTGQPERRPALRRGCWRLLLGLLVAAAAVGLFILRWLWRLGRSGRAARREISEMDEVVFDEVREVRGRQRPRLRPIDLLVAGVVLLSLALIPLAIWGVPDRLSDPAILSAWRDEPQASWLRTGHAWEPDETKRAAVRATESARLNSYGWQDEEAGVARIPLERAKDLLLERGESLVMTPLPTVRGTAPTEPAVSATPETP